MGVNNDLYRVSVTIQHIFPAGRGETAICGGRYVVFPLQNAADTLFIAFSRLGPW